MQQVIIIHGGDSFASRTKFYRALKKQTVSIKIFLPKPKGWKALMPGNLGRKYQVLLPQMPNKENAEYTAWKIWFERIRPYTKNDVILIGHSQGGIFLAKYLSEHKFPKKIKALILVAAPHHLSKEIGSFRLKNSLAKVTQQCRDIHLLYSINDPIVPFREMKEYQRVWPRSRTHVFKNKKHFNQARFPELVRLIKNL